MLRSSIIGSAVGLWFLVALGCVLNSDTISPHDPTSGRQRTAPPQFAKLEGLPYRGVAMQIQRVDWIEEYKKAIDEIADLGADSFLCIVDARQENGVSAKIYLDWRMTPTRAQLADLIGYAKSKKLRVILMPIVLLDAPRGNEWRGTIKPAGDAGGWEAWFESYRAMMTEFAIVAQQTGVDVLVVGSELVSSQSNAEQWDKTIRHIRGIYKGLLTYSSNWDAYDRVPFWDQLDLIGMNSYWTLDKGWDARGNRVGKKNQVTVAEIVENWREIQAEVEAFSRKKGKPVLLLEAGWCSLKNAADEPWDYTKSDLPLDLDLQKRLWEGFFQAWQGNPYMAGFMVWAWAPNDGGLEDKGYTPKGKPAYEVIKTWMAKPWRDPAHP